jgi:hypothetical protein
MHYDTDIWRAVEQLGDLAVHAARQMPRDLKPVLGARIVEETGYMAILVREAAMAKGRAKVPHYEQLLAGVALTHSHRDRARICNVVLARGLAVDHRLTKAYA